MGRDTPPGISQDLQRRDAAEQQLPQSEAMPLALSLSQNQFVGTASDRQAEAQQFTGWNHVAISALMRAATRAEVAVYDDRVVPGKRGSLVNYQSRAMRKSLLLNHGAKWKSFSKDDAVKQMASPEFRWWKLTYQPNPWLTGSQLRSTVIQQLHLHGICMVWNVKNVFGKTVWRFPVPMAAVTPIAPGQYKQFPMGGIHVYSFGWMIDRFGRGIVKDRTFAYLSDRDIPMEDLTVYQYPHPFLVGDGASPTTAQEQRISVSNRALKTLDGQLEQGPQRKVLLHPPADQANDTVSLKSWQKHIDRLIRENETGVIAAAHGGATELTIAPDEMGYIETDDRSAIGIFAAHGVSKAAAGMQDGMTYGSLAAAMRGFQTMSVQPDLDIMADEDTAQMQSEEGDAFEIRYTCPDFDDPELDEQRLANDKAAGALSLKEYRAKRGMDPYGDERDDLPAGGQAIMSWGVKEPANPMDMFGAAMTGKPPALGGSEAPAVSEAPGSDSGDPGFMGRFTGLLGGKQAKSLQSPTLLTYPNQPKPFVVAVAFDGTLCQLNFESDAGDIDLGSPNMAIVEVVRTLKDAGCGIVVYTASESETLVAEWLQRNTVPWDGININPWSEGLHGQIPADMFLDERAVNASSGVMALASVIDQLDEVGRQQLRDAVYKRRVDRHFGFLFVPVEGSALRLVREAKAMLWQEHVDGDALEVEPHITLLHQVAENDPFGTVTKLSALAKFDYEVGRLLVFRRGDVSYLVIGLGGNGLHEAFSSIYASVTHCKSEFDFTPHITIGKIKTEFADLYDGKPLPSTGAFVRVNRLIYRPPGYSDFVIPLK
jgi:2'-5' RNA ligase